VSISPSNANMNVGETLNFAVQITGGSASTTLSSCTSSSATVATAAVNAGACRVTAVAAGNATITATTSTGKSAAAAVAVAAPAPAITGLTVSPTAAQVAVGQSVTLVPTVNRANASVNVAYTYISSATAVATVDATGRVTAVAPGVASITITAAGTGTGFASASLTTAAAITVSDRTPGLTTLQVSPTTASLLTGATQQVTATAQGPRASAATITYGTSAPAIATVNASGLITAVAPGTATITVTAQATEQGSFAASSITGLVTVTVTAPAQVTVSLSGITQGPTITSYAATATSGGITSANNAQVNLPVDVANVRDQIQVLGTLASNGARVDSVVVYVANADGSNRVSAASRTYANGVAASGDLTFFVNTADFTADFAAGTAAVRFPNGQRQLSISAWSGTTEIRAAATQTLAFNNVDGYAARVTAPARSATNATTGLLYHGGPDSLRTSLGSTTVVPVFYTAGRTLARATLSMRQGALGDTQTCSEILEFQAGPYQFVYGGARAVAVDTTVVNCSTLQSDSAHVVGVTAATDNSGSTAPITTFAAGFRTSATVTAPTALRLDYVAPTVTAVNRTRTLPAVTGWVNATYNFNTQTDVSVDAGVGFPGTTAAAQKAGRTWQWWGCGVLSTAPNTFTGLAGDLNECATNTGAAAYSIRYTDVDLLGNLATSAAVTVGVDKTAPLARWATTSPGADSVGNAAAVLTPEVYDALSGFADDASNPATADTAANRAVRGFVVRANAGLFSATLAPTSAQCYRLDGTQTGQTTVSAGSSFMTAPSCSASTTGNALLGLPGADGYRAAAGVAAAANTITLASVSVLDRAGNSTTITRRYFSDNTAPTAAAIAAPGSIGTSNPTLAASYADNVKVAGANVSFTYGLNLDGQGAPDNFVLPYQVQSTPFANTLNAENTSATLSIATPAPMATSLNVTGATAYTKLFGFQINAFNAFGTAAIGADQMAPSGLTTFTALTSGLTFTVGTSLSAANGAAAGLKATFNTGSTSGTNVFARVDFYRRNGPDNYEYLGSGSSAVQSVDLNNNQLFTYVIDSYVGNPTTGATQRTAAAGDVILAMAVRSTGAATISTATTIGGPALRIEIAGTDGNPGNVVITGPNGFTQTVTVTGTYGMPTAGDYTVTQFPVTTANGGRYFIATNPASAVIGTYTLVANGAPQTAQVQYSSATFSMSYVPVAPTPAWPGVPTGAFVTLANATTGFSQVFRATTANFLLPTVGSAFTWAPAAAAVTSTSPIEGVANVAYSLSPGNNFVPTAAASSGQVVAVAYEYSNAIAVGFTCATAACPAGMSGTYRIGDGVAPAFTLRKEVATTSAGTLKVHGLAGLPAVTTRAFATTSFSTTNAAAVAAGLDRGWMVDNATADFPYGLSSGNVVGTGASLIAGANTIAFNLVQATIGIAPARIGNGAGTQFQPNVTITKANDANCAAVTLPEITAGAAASAVRLFNPICGAGTYIITFNPTTIGGQTVSWITGAGVRIQSVSLDGNAPAAGPTAAVWYN
jgi:uncharacterized protein YjdB